MYSYHLYLAQGSGFFILYYNHAIYDEGEKIQRNFDVYKLFIDCSVFIINKLLNTLYDIIKYTLDKEAFTILGNSRDSALRVLK